MTTYANGAWTFAAPQCPECIRVRTAQGFPPVPEAEWGVVCDACKPLPTSLPLNPEDDSMATEFLPVPTLGLGMPVDEAAMAAGEQGVVAPAEDVVQQVEGAAWEIATQAVQEDDLNMDGA